MNPKVLICCPIGGHKQYSINLWFEWIANQSYKNYDVAVCTNGNTYSKLAEKISEVEIVDIHKQTKIIKPLKLFYSNDLSTIQKITYSREMLRRYAVENNYDYLFYLDTDTIPLNKDTIQILINRNVDCISGLYFYKGTKQPVIIDLATHTNISLDKCAMHFKEKSILEVWGFGFGCLLLSKKAFTHAEFNYDLFGEERSDDFGYCHVLQNNGVLRWFDPSVICHHVEDPNISSVPMSHKFVIPVLTHKTINKEISFLSNDEHKIRSEDKIKKVDTKKE